MILGYTEISVKNVKKRHEYSHMSRFLPQITENLPFRRNYPGKPLKKALF